jgi:hypothetical protein
MVRKPLILLFVKAELLFLAGLLNAANHIGSITVACKCAMNGEKVLSMADVLCINGSEIAPGIRKVIYCIKQVGLSLAIITDKAVDLLREGDIGFAVVFKIGYLEAP